MGAVLEDLWHPLEHVYGRAWPSLGQVKHLPGVQQTLEPGGGCVAVGRGCAAARRDYLDAVGVCKYRRGMWLQEEGVHLQEVAGWSPYFCISLTPWLPPDLGFRKTIRGELLEKGRGLVRKQEYGASTGAWRRGWRTGVFLAGVTCSSALW